MPVALNPVGYWYPAESSPANMGYQYPASLGYQYPAGLGYQYPSHLTAWVPVPDGGPGYQYPVVYSADAEQGRTPTHLTRMTPQQAPQPRYPAVPGPQNETSTSLLARRPRARRGTRRYSPSK